MSASASILEKAYKLSEEGRVDDALAIIEPWAKLPKPDHATLSAYATVLKRAGRHEEAVETFRIAAERFSTDGVAWHNYASMLMDLARPTEAAQASEKALAAGLDAPEAWLIWARANQGMHDVDKAERGFREVLKRRAEDADAARDLAQLVWMRTADVEAAAAVYDEAVWSPLLAVHKARIYKYAGLYEEALKVIEDGLPKAPQDGSLLQSAVQHAMEAEKWDRALVYAQHNVQRMPNNIIAIETWAGANLALGKHQEALRAARHVVKSDPERQAGWAVLAACARAAGEPEYEALYDYDAFVRPGEISAPTGWATVEAYLAELRTALNDVHIFKTHPIDQSLRHGTQSTRDVRDYDHPAIQAFFPAIAPLIQNYMDAVGEGDDPLRRRNTRKYEIGGAWSVRLRPCGFHVDHIHPEGWLSSAFYVETPKSALEHPDREGWIKFGVPGLPLPEKPEPGHFQRPVPGKLVLFPSYMWHGTVPFTTDESRMTIAFDIVPA